MNSNCHLPWQRWKRKILFARAITIHVNSGCPISPLAMAKSSSTEAPLPRAGGVFGKTWFPALGPSKGWSGSHATRTGPKASSARGPKLRLELTSAH
ncbi:unnamed protein product [Prunus armeniaca]